MRFWVYLWRALALRCPSCGERTFVRRLGRVNEQCRACGLFFVHDDGSWLGAWHFNFFISGLVAIVPAAVFVARNDWSTGEALAWAIAASLLLPIALYWHSYSLWTATYYYFVPDDLRMGLDRPSKHLTAEEEAALSPEERERLWVEEAVLDLEGDRHSRIG